MVVSCSQSMGSPALSSLRSFCRSFSGFSPSTIGAGGGESMVYQMSMLRRPPTVNYSERVRNSCSLIGIVMYDPRRCSVPSSAVYTVLDVKRPSPSSNHSSIRLLLIMLDKLAKVSLKYLKPNDFIYVCGPIYPYEKHDGNEDHKTLYKVIVQDLNYVKRYEQTEKSKEPKSSTEEESRTIVTTNTRPPENAMDNKGDVNHLRLWQIFFANPREWWDNRQRKRYLGSPDFRHKDTGESLRLRPDDPPWILSQLQLHDSYMSTLPDRSTMNEWKLEHLE